MGEALGRVTLWGIEVFLATAEDGAISTAARRLGVSPSAVSQQLAGLEAALGVVLLDRSARPMQMTPAGAMFRRHAQTMLNAEAEARAELAMADLSALTTLRLGMIEDFDATVTPRLLSGLAADLRGCRFLLETGASHRLLDLLDARALDIVVAADMGAAQAPVDPAAHEVHPILSEPFVVVCPKGAFAGDADRAARLMAAPYLQYSSRHLMGRQIAAHLAAQNLRPAGRFELDSYAAILALVAAGAGWTILTPLALLHADRFADAVDVCPLPWGRLSRSINLTARSGVLKDMPVRITRQLRDLVEAVVIAPTLARLPWAADDLRLL